MTWISTFVSWLTFRTPCAASCFCCKTSFNPWNLPIQLHGPNNSTLLDTAYHDLLQLDFCINAQGTWQKVYCAIFVGTQGSQRGVPLQIRYQSNWWFQVVSNLRPTQNPPTQNPPPVKALTAR
jgi:hypothetical protein